MPAAKAKPAPRAAATHPDLTVVSNDPGPAAKPALPGTEKAAALPQRPNAERARQALHPDRVWPD